MKKYLLLTLILPVACTPTVRLDTPEPVKIDVAMKVDVYTHEQESSGTADQKKQKEASPAERRRQRMAEVQELKNDRIVGEGHDGFLKMKDVPTDPVYADYAQRIVAEENADRQALFEQEADAEDKPVDVVAREFGERAREASFPGEWVQPEPDQWVQK